MRDYELDGLKSLRLKGNADIVAWRAKTGLQYRVKVRNTTGQLVYISDLRSEKKQKMVVDYYKVPLKKLQERIHPTYKVAERYRHIKGKHSETHVYQHIRDDEFYDLLEQVLLQQDHAFKFNVALGYTLVEKGDPLAERHYHPNFEKTALFDKPMVVNTRKDARKIVEQARQMILENAINYEASKYVVKTIGEFKLTLYYRSHKMGSPEAVIPEVIRLNKHVLNFPQPPQSNKCLMFCIAYHLQEGEKRPRHRMDTLTKQVVRKYLAFKGQVYTDRKFPAAYKNFPAVDIYQLSDIEDCFKINIEVYMMDEETEEFRRAIESTKSYDNTLNILSHNNHAMYITDVDRFMGKHACPKCEIVFVSSEKLRNHKKNKCDKAYFKSFVKSPTLYRPPPNKISAMLERHGIKDVTPFADHYLVYDFEAILKPLEAEKKAKLSFTNMHIPVSVSVCDSLTEEVRCFVNDSPKLLLQEMFEYAKTKQLLIAEYNRNKFKVLRQKVNKRIDRARERNEAFPNKIAAAAVRSSLKDLDDLDKVCDNVPLLGFNSGSYDMNLIKDELFAALAHCNGCIGITSPGRPKKLKDGEEAPKGKKLAVSAIKSANGYMCLTAGGIKMLDITKYMSAGTSLRQYLEAYAGKCTCADEIACTCQMGKGFFPYEYLTSFDMLDKPGPPPRSAFDSKLRSTKLTDKEWKRVQWVWEHYETKTLRELLVWYNNLDVIPFMKAIKEQMKFFHGFGLDMFHDGVSLPGLAEKIMYQTCYEDENYIQPRDSKPPKPFEFGKKRLESYWRQDKEANRKFDLTMDHLKELLAKQSYLCWLCYEPLTKKTASADRINNFKGHINGNVLITCKDCNCARKDIPIHVFKKRKLLEHNANRLIYSVDEEQSEIYNLMERNITGGPSIIFNRFAKAGFTVIRGGKKKCMKIIGYDANALYLWCLVNDMPCGRPITIPLYDGLVDGILADKQFGFIECDIETPEHLKAYFKEMTPIFKNDVIEPTGEVIGDFMADIGKKETKKASHKLFGSYFGKKILIYTPLLKWYLAHGMVVTKVHTFVKCHAARPFEKFGELVSDARRAGEAKGADKSKVVIAKAMKLVGNSPYGRAAMNQTKYKNVVYSSDDLEVSKKIEHYLFKGLEELQGGNEISNRKRNITLKNPIHMALAVYQLAKIRMFQFYYDCIGFYVDRSDFEYQEMDTDSGYIAFSGENPFPDLVKPELREHFEAHKNEWFSRTDTEEHALYDTRTPGLFKEEWRGGASELFSLLVHHVHFNIDLEAVLNVAELIDVDSWEVLVRCRELPVRVNLSLEREVLPDHLFSECVHPMAWALLTFLQMVRDAEHKTLVALRGLGEVEDMLVESNDLWDHRLRRAHLMTSIVERQLELTNGLDHVLTRLVVDGILKNHLPCLFNDFASIFAGVDYHRLVEERGFLKVGMVVTLSKRITLLHQRVAQRHIELEGVVLLKEHLLEEIVELVVPNMLVDVGLRMLALDMAVALSHLVGRMDALLQLLQWHLVVVNDHFLFFL